MIDIPEEQAQEEYVLDLIKNGHLLYMASSGYGKSVLLTNIVLGLAMKNSVRNLNFYIWDLGNSALIPLRALPHVADYMSIDDSEKIGKFQKRILDEIADRKRKFAKAMAQNIHVYNESQEEPLKVIAIIIDNFDTLKETGDESEAFVQKVARDGASLGIYLCVTMTRVNAMRSSVLNSFKERIGGYNFEPGENRTLIGRSEYSLPDDKKGRVLVKRDNVNVMQLYTPVPCKDELSYIDNLKKLVRKVEETSSEERAKGIPILPEELYYSMLPEYPGYREALTELPIGIEVENLDVQYLNVRNETALIIGMGGMGRTNTLCNILRHIQGQKVYLFDAKNMNLRMYENESGIVYAGDEKTIMLALQEIKEETDRRREQYEQQEDIRITLKEFGQSLKPVFVIVDWIYVNTLDKKS